MKKYKILFLPAGEYIYFPYKYFDWPVSDGGIWTNKITARTFIKNCLLCYNCTWVFDDGTQIELKKEYLEIVEVN